MDPECNTKIRKVLNKLLDPEFKIKNDVYLTSLLTHLTESQEGTCNVDYNINKQDISTWLMQAINHWEKSEKASSAPILSFTLNVTSYVCKDEQTFVMLNSHNVYERLIKLLSAEVYNAYPSIKLGYIRLVTALLEHKSGLQWIISTNYWADIMALALKNQTIYITKEGYVFMARLLDKSVKINELFCVHVVQLIMAPLSKNAPCMPGNNMTNLLEVRDQAIYQSLCSTLTLITEVLEIFLKDIEKGNDLKVVYIFVDKFNLEECIKSILCIATNEEFFLRSIKNLEEKGGYIEFERATSSKSLILIVLKENVCKGYIPNVIKLSYIGFIYWSYIRQKMPVCKRHGDNVPMIFENQMLMLQLYPIISVSFKLLGEEKAMQVLDEDDLRDDYVSKFCKIIIPETLRIVYQWRTQLFSHPQVFDHATLSLKYLIKSKQFFTRELGVISFQTLMYCLRDVVQVLKEQPEQALILSKEHNYLALVIDAITMFINEFNITWTESLESICVLNLIFELLSLPTWSAMLVVKGLKLIDIAITKYMSPSMALLIDNVDNSSLALTGPLLYAKLHDGNWEVRDTALEVLCTISTSERKKVVLDAELPSLILKMSVSDGEPFVRATALRCLQEMVQIQEFWCDLTKSGNVHEQIVQILERETEGIVRSQAATLIAVLYEHQEDSPSTLSHFYDIMTHAATADLHWEVKVNALLFWEKVITFHLTHQGMIDGVFPKVTFSKEHRKIVTLNEHEVRKRLIQVLNQLSETGCLAVLVTAMRDDCDVEVIKAATKITDKFVRLLKDYRVRESNADLSSPPSPLTPFNAPPPSMQ
ncbi:hypothetical protein NQ318_019149 [Aromia moschata]|uniref:Uncharacterized protein n=1 Tax=Aromia moschata TaxID=1265417 RepID=A0AAV8YR28_9CUCU|nr:hypothetical protein NQ318_019149 [Aromia moschata]